MNAHGQRGVATRFDAAWNGTGMPPAAECTMTVYDDDGNVVVEHDFTYVMGSSAVDNNRDELFPPPQERRGPPADGKLTCSEM